MLDVSVSLMSSDKHALKESRTKCVTVANLQRDRSKYKTELKLKKYETKYSLTNPEIRIEAPVARHRATDSLSGVASYTLHTDRNRVTTHTTHTRRFGTSVPFQYAMASSATNRQNSRQQFPRMLSSRAQSQSAIQRPPTMRGWPTRTNSQLSDVVLQTSPLLNRSTSPNKLLSQSDGATSLAKRFNLGMMKSRNISEISTSARRKRSKVKSARTQANLSIAATLAMSKQPVKSVRKDGLTPLRRFRRAARLVKLLVTISNVCRDLLVYAIKDEQWYEFCEKFLKDASEGGTPIDTNAFVTTTKNPDTKEFVRLEFDSTQFKHDYHSGVSLLTNEIKAILGKRPGSRSQKELEECIHCIKRLVPAFRAYTYDQQKKICQLVMYDRYFQERVILREKLPPDGIYFVLNGTLMESGAKMQSPRIIKPGDKFGEEDLKSGMTRQTNVVTKSSVDLLYLHKFDYEEIFELSVDLSGDEFKVFDICKQELVFKYYPIAELVKNPGRWQVLKFKYGRLIASNSCQTECIYVIRSGEARVMKHIETRTINVAQRRRRLQDELDSADPYVNRKRLLDFVSDNKFQTSRYTLNAFGAKNLAAGSIPIEEKIKHLTTGADIEKTGKTGKTVQRPKTSLPKMQIEGADSEEQVSDTDRDDADSKSHPIEITPPRNTHREKVRAQTAIQLQQNIPIKSSKAPRPHTTKPSSQHQEHDMYRARKAAVNKAVPPFVQVDSLHAGQTYGMRSLLPVDLQGEPAALVSAGCEVIQINRKFFAKYLDENMINIIALKAKVYPSEDELLKRLDVNLQWEEYCAVVMCSYLDSKVVGFRGSHVVQPQ